MFKEKFLLRLLAGIFIFQGIIFGSAFIYCAKSGGLGACPNIKETYENTFTLMTATTLALLTGQAVVKGRE